MVAKFAAALYEFVYEPLETLRLPRFKGNLLRGGFGAVFKNLVCVAGHGCPPCQLKEKCPYGYLFETPVPTGAAVLRLNEHVPHPFVIRPPLDERREYPRGERLSFGVMLIGRGVQYLPYFVIVFQQLGRQGLGRELGRMALDTVTAVSAWDGTRTPLYSAGLPTLQPDAPPMTWADVERRAAALPTDRMRVRFLTPTRLKHGGGWARRPEFHILIRALLRRLSSLAYFHCGERLEADFRGLIAQAEQVRLGECDLRWVERERWSGRQQRAMSLGGLVGEAEYVGDLSPFRSLLAAGELLHVGKATVFGNGLFRVGDGGLATTHGRKGSQEGA